MRERDAGGDKRCHMCVCVYVCVCVCTHTWYRVSRTHACGASFPCLIWPFCQADLTQSLLLFVRLFVGNTRWCGSSSWPTTRSSSTQANRRQSQSRWQKWPRSPNPRFPLRTSRRWPMCVARRTEASPCSSMSSSRPTPRQLPTPSLVN